MKCYITYLLGLILLFVNTLNARSINYNEKIKKGDKYYLIYINNEHGEYKVFSEGKNQKRQESQIYIESLVDRINNIIINNKDTYENPEKLEEIEQASQLRKRKRSEEDQELYSYDESNFVYPISSINNKVVLFAYLSETLAKELPYQIENIIECTPDKATLKVFNKNYNIDEILAETHWKDVSVREDADFHLSLMSQGKFDGSSEDYDDNYYYPSSAGKDVDIVILDSSFNFNYSEFSNTEERTVECTGIIDNGKVSTDVSKGCALSNLYHGEITSVCAAGLTDGVASRANVYGIVVPVNRRGEIQDSDILAGVQYIYENMIRRPHKTVINFSLGGLEKQGSTYLTQYKELIDGITEKGGIVVAASGNDGSDLDKVKDIFIPCEFENVICVGGVTNDEKDFSFVYDVADFSNYGKNVDFYAPSTVEIKIVKKKRVVKTEDEGTSYSSPLVAGLIANIISENMDIEYTKEAIVNQLLSYGKDLTITLDNDDLGIFANNGKRIVYSNKSIDAPSTTSDIKTTTTTVNPPTPVNTNASNVNSSTTINNTHLTTIVSSTTNTINPTTFNTIATN